MAEFPHKYNTIQYVNGSMEFNDQNVRLMVGESTILVNYTNVYSSSGWTLKVESTVEKVMKRKRKGKSL